MKKLIMIVSLISIILLALCSMYIQCKRESVQDDMKPTPIIGTVETVNKVNAQPIKATPKNEVTENIIGKLENVAEAIEQERIENSYLGVFKVTAYCGCDICCGDWSDGITYTGTVATAGRTIAVDPNIIPYGTEVTFNGRTYIAEDCGGAIKGNRIDLYFDNHHDALEFGIQYFDVYKNYKGV